MTNDMHKAEVGRRLRIAIEAMQTTQADVCRELGISQGKLNNWLRGEHYPDPLIIARFCDHFAVSADWIYRGLAGNDHAVAAASRAVSYQALALHTGRRGAARRARAPTFQSGSD